MSKNELKKLENNIWKIYLFHIFKNLAFFVPVIVLFWQDNGLSMTEIMLLQSIFAITMVILEIPTGYFADIFGRKNSLAYSGAFLFVSTLIYGIGNNFIYFLAAELFWGLGISFLSGSDSALMYDTLKDLKKENEYKKIWGNSIFLSMIAIGIANIIGAYIGKINLRLPFFFMLPFLLALIPLALTIKEPKRHKLIIKKGYFIKLIKIVKELFLKEKKLKWLMIYAGVSYAFYQSALWFYQPYFSLSGLKIIHFGYIFASFQIVAALSSKYAHKIEEKIGEKYSLIMLIFLTGAGYLFMSNFIYLFSFMFAFFHQFVRGFSKIIISDYINKLTKSEIRATILSVKNMIAQLIYAIIIPFAGWIADVYSLTQALSVLGITTIITGSIILVVLHKNKVI